MPDQERIDEGMAFLKKHWPERYAWMDQLRTDDPESFGLAFRSIWPRLVRVIELSRRNPALAEAEVGLVKIESKLRETAREYFASTRRDGAEDSAKAKGPQARSNELLATLKDLVSQRFDLEIKRAELRIQELSEELAQQRERLETRRENKQDEVDRTVKELTSDPRLLRRHRGHRGGSRGDLEDRRRPMRGRGPGREGDEGFRKGPRRIERPPASKPAD